MASTSEKANYAIPETKEWANVEDANWIPEETDSDETSIAYTYYSVDSTNMTRSDLTGAGRLLGNLYSRLGRSLEYRIFSTNAKRWGADPQEVGARIRSMSLWQCQPGEEEVWALRRQVSPLSDSQPQDAKLLRRCCRAILYYTSTDVYETVVSALREIIDLSIRYFPVREAFNAVRATDALRILPLCIKRVVFSDAEQLRKLRALIKKALLCLSDNLVYSACRRSFQKSSWHQELDGIELRLTLEGFLSHQRLGLIAADLIIAFGLEQRESSPGRIFDFVQSRTFWDLYRHKKHSIGFRDLVQHERDIITKCCKNLLLYVNAPSSPIKIAALEVVIKLSKQFRSVREAFADLDAIDYLQRISIEPDQESKLDSTQLTRVHNLITDALFSLKNNEIYDLVKESTLRKSWTPEVEGAILRLDLEEYRCHPKLKTLAAEHINFIELFVTFYHFERYARSLLDPRWTEYGPDDKKELSIARVCFALVKFATKSSSLRTRVTACKHIENIIFNHPSSRAIFMEVNLAERLANVDLAVVSRRSRSELDFADRLPTLSNRIVLCLQDHEVFPKSIAYFKELSGTLLDMIFEYLRSPELFFIGAKVLSRTWLKVIFLYEDMFSRVVTFLLGMLEEIAEQPEAELVVVSVLNKLFEGRSGPQCGSHHPAKYAELIDKLSTPALQVLYPRAFGTIQEYRERLELAVVDQSVSRWKQFTAP